MSTPTSRKMSTPTSRKMSTPTSRKMSTPKMSKNCALQLLNGNVLSKIKEGTIELPVKEKNGTFYLTKKDIKKILNLKEIENHLRSNNGEGFFSALKERIGTFGNKIISTIKNLISPALQSTFQTLSNGIRRLNPNFKQEDLLNKGELHPTGIVNGNIVPYRFLGPGTNLKERLQRGDKPVNRLDKVAEMHDLAYEKAGELKNPQERAMAIHQADSNMINELQSHPELYRNDPFYNEAIAIITGKFSAEKLLSLLKGEAKTIYGGVLPIR